jgi:hypothetical protein
VRRTASGRSKPHLGIPPRTPQGLSTSPLYVRVHLSSPKDPVLIPWVYVVHVISQDDTLEGGNVPDSQIYEQIDILNKDYATTDVSFTLAGVTRTTNAFWFNSVGPNQCVFTISPFVTLAHQCAV